MHLCAVPITGNHWVVTRATNSAPYGIAQLVIKPYGLLKYISHVSRP